VPIASGAVPWRGRERLRGCGQGGRVHPSTLDGEQRSSPGLNSASGCRPELRSAINLFRHYRSRSQWVRRTFLLYTGFGAAGGVVTDLRGGRDRLRPAHGFRPDFRRGRLGFRSRRSSGSATSPSGGCLLQPPAQLLLRHLRRAGHLHYVVSRRTPPRLSSTGPAPRVSAPLLTLHHLSSSSPSARARPGDRRSPAKSAAAGRSSCRQPGHQEADPPEVLVRAWSGRLRGQHLPDRLVRDVLVAVGRLREGAVPGG